MTTGSIERRGGTGRLVHWRQANGRSAMRRWLLAGAVLSMVAAAPGRADAAALYGLVVGIDDYVGSANDLQGSVNDARDISQALERARASRIVTLTNGEATKDAVSSAFAALVDAAAPGDTVVFTFSGHGAQEPEPADRHGEADGKNETLLLAGYQPKGGGTRERIVDDEIFAWMQAADKKGVRVVFVADACHSGTMNRSIGASPVRYRVADYGPISDDELALPSPEFATMTEDDLKLATFVGATTDDRLTPEVEIDGEWRGALSWSFARAIEGYADRDGDGEVSQFELVQFLVPSVASLVESQQTPQVVPLRPSNDMLFAVGRTAEELQVASVETGSVVRRAEEAPLKVAVEGGDAGVLDGLTGVELVEDAGEADLIWSAGEGTVSHRLGGKVAEGALGRQARPVIAKFAALKWLKATAAVDPVTARITTGNGRYKIGSTIEVEIGGQTLPYLTLFNMPPDGKVEFFVPAGIGEASKDWRNEVIRERFQVSKPPYGAEHLVAIFSDEPLVGLHAVLGEMTTGDKAVVLRRALEEVMKGRKFQVGVLDIYTGD
ncbi:MAG: caspase family protein [Hyphomicrobiaceae bacterium]